MIKITLDTNCIINLLDYKSKSATSVDELAEILRYGLDGDISIAITTRVESDINKDENEERKLELIKRISMFPAIGTVPRINKSKLDSGDALGGEEHIRLEQEIKGIIFPGLKPTDSHYNNKINDIDHLIGHKINKRDIFITDDQQILKRAETLRDAVGIEVMNPKNTVKYLNEQGNRAVLTQEFYDKFLEYKSLVLDVISGEKSEAEVISEYEEFRKWLVRKYSLIQTGLLNYKFQMVSVPTGGKRLFNQDDLMSLQTFNDRFNGILKERSPLKIPGITVANRLGYGMNYRSAQQEVQGAIDFLNSIEDALLGYLGYLERH